MIPQQSSDATDINADAGVAACSDISPMMRK
jgi:hypothetical protein